MVESLILETLISMYTVGNIVFVYKVVDKFLFLAFFTLISSCITFAAIIDTKVSDYDTIVKIIILIALTYSILTSFLGLSSLTKKSN